MDFEAYLARVDGFVTAGNYHAALNIALSGMNACRRQEDQAGVDRCLEVIRGIVERLQQEYGSAGEAADATASPHRTTVPRP
jgi:hypothetical protein